MEWKSYTSDSSILIELDSIEIKKESSRTVNEITNKMGNILWSKGPSSD